MQYLLQIKEHVTSAFHDPMTDVTQAVQYLPEIKEHGTSAFHNRVAEVTQAVQYPLEIKEHVTSAIQWATKDLEMDTAGLALILECHILLAAGIMSIRTHMDLIIMELGMQMQCMDSIIMDFHTPIIRCHVD